MNTNQNLFSILILLLMEVGLGLPEVDTKTYSASFTKFTFSKSRQLNYLGAWHLDEGTGVVAFPFKGSSNINLVNNPIWVQGHSGQAVYFNGLNQYGSTTLPLHGSTQITISAWIKTNIIQGGDYIVSIPRIFTGFNGFDIRTSFGHITCCNGYGGSGFCFGGAVNYADGIWHNVTATYDGTTSKLYFDGNLIGSQANSGLIVTDNNQVQIGRFGNYGNGLGFEGAIDDVIIDNRAWTINEIINIVNGVQDADEDGYTSDLDCDDTNASVHPGAAEICNSIDDDCDGFIDEGVTNTFYRDMDGDAFGNLQLPIQACTQPMGYVTNYTDCDDQNSTLYPMAADNTCNGIDNDCDGLVDEDFTTSACQVCSTSGLIQNPVRTWYLDSDGDNHALLTKDSCYSPGIGFTTNNLPLDDCNDHDATIHPNSLEINCNGIDEDCDGVDGSCNPCSLGDLDADGICDVQDNCKVFNPLQIDSDCDGIGDQCDICNGGNDKIDLNQDGKPDCAYPPGFTLLPSSWICANNKVFVCKVDEVANTVETSCISFNGLKGVVKEGKKNYCGPCNESRCTNNLGGIGYKGSPEPKALDIFPNPSNGEIRFKLLKLNNNTNYNISIYNSLGSLMWQQSAQVISNSIVHLNLKEFLSMDGIYILQLSNGESIVQKKFIVEKK